MILQVFGKRKEYKGGRKAAKLNDTATVMGPLRSIASIGEASLDRGEKELIFLCAKL